LGESIGNLHLDKRFYISIRAKRSVNLYAGGK